MNLLSARRLPNLLLALFILGYAVIFTYLTFIRFDAFEARSLDLGNFDQAIWNTAQGRWFHLTNQPGIINRLSLHVEPILIPISALYWIYSSPKTLLLLQAIIVALGAIPLYALAKRELGFEWLALIFAGTYLLNPSIQAANWLEFHGVTLAPTFLLAAFYYLRTEQNGRFALFAILAASCKEEIALLVLMMGFYSLVVQKRYRFGGITMLLSFSWALIAVLGVQQFFGSGNIHWGRYGYLGESPGQIVQTMMTQPGLLIEQLQKAQAGIYVLRLLVPVAFIGILAPEILLLALPSLSINMLADFSPMHQVDTLIYAVPIVPFVLIAGVFGLRRILLLIQSSRASAITAALSAALILGCTLVNHAAYGYTPGSGNYLPLQITEHHRAAQEIIQQIPPDAKVSVQDRLNPHVSQRETVYIYPRVEDELIGDADTIFIDVTGPAHPLHPSSLHEQIWELLGADFGVAAAYDGYLLLRQGAESTALPESFYTPWQINPEESLEEFLPLDITFNDQLQLIGAHVTTDRYGELVTELAWRLLAEDTRDLTIYVAYLGDDGQPLHDTRFYPLPASLWYPTSLWEVGNPADAESVSTHGNRYRVKTLPWTLEADRFTLAVGVFYADSGPEWSSAERLSISQADPAYPLLEGDTLARIGGFDYRRDNSLFGDNSFFDHNIQNLYRRGAWSKQPPAGQPAEALNVQFGTQILLDGVTLHTATTQPGAQVRVDLHWQAVEQLSQDYSLFVHLVSEESDLIAQLDRQPADQAGFLPMTSWPVGTAIVDTIELALPKTASAGRYRLLAGLYFWQDGQRLPITDTDAQTNRVTDENAFELGWIEITR